MVTVAAVCTVSNAGIIAHQYACMAVSKVKSLERVEMEPIEAQSVPVAAVLQALFLMFILACVFSGLIVYIGLALSFRDWNPA